jgi:cytochrome c-type biogenesis protein CcmF
MPYALLIATFIAFSQFLNYNSNESATFIKKQGIPLGLSLILTIVSLLAGIVSNLNLSFFLFFILFALLSSIANLVFQTARPRNFPAIITHIGFITFLLGTLVTFSNSVIVSTNTSKYDLGDAKANEENLLLMRYDTLYMGDYYVSYINNRKEGNTTTYRIDFLKFEKENFRREFSLYPSVNANPRMGSVYNPDTRHFLLRDYYTYISAVSQEPDYIVIKTIMNPYIGVLWAGALVMIAGFGYAFARRARRNWNMVW